MVLKSYKKDSYDAWCTSCSHHPFDILIACNSFIFWNYFLMKDYCLFSIVLLWCGGVLCCSVVWCVVLWCGVKCVIVVCCGVLWCVFKYEFHARRGCVCMCCGRTLSVETIFFVPRWWITVLLPCKSIELDDEICDILKSARPRCKFYLYSRRKKKKLNSHK